MRTTLAIWLWVIIGLLFAKAVKADTIETASVDVFKIWHNYDPHFDHTLIGQPGEGEEFWTWGMKLNLDLSLWQVGPVEHYMLNTIPMKSTNRQVRYVGWEFENGLHLGQYFDVGWYHFSEHKLEMQTDYFYPLQDQFFVRVYLKR